MDTIIEKRPELVPAPTSSGELVEQFCEFLSSAQQRKEITIYIHRTNLVNLILPYFHNVCKVESLQEFQKYSRRLSIWLREDLGLTDTKIRYVQMSLRVFWKWLGEQGLVEGAPLYFRRVKKQIKGTPLRRTLTPDEVLNWQFPRPDLRLIALVGYFFSLRTQETFGLKKADFLGGKVASEFECCKVMAAAHLYDRLAIRIERQRGKEGLSAPKQHSSGLVACFNSIAAQEIAAIVNASDGPLFTLNTNYYVKLWREHGIPNTTIKDLRRASLYWLGHYSDLELVALKNHARHKEVSTTILYTRRPSTQFEESTGPLVL
ncbi:MAG: hypothetical protein EOP06_21330 [Proteobacteria bacterium]|nr:MAG: hypothetical protein EOP06_21330 [Pseudomonadota bacterium]